MKKILVAISVCLSFFTCKEGVKTEVSANVSVTDSLQIAGDSIAHSVGDFDLIDDNLYPKNERLPLLVLSTGVFHEDETSPESINKGWFGIFSDRGKYYMTPTRLTIKKAFDAIADDNEDDPSTWTGWQVKTSHIDTALVLISGSPRFSSHEIKTVPLRTDIVEANEKMSFSFNGASYKLYSTADVTPDESNGGGISIRNYKLYIKGYKNGKEMDQLLASTPHLDAISFRILFIGDIDDDGFPDLILDTTNHYNLYRPTVYLSSFADTNQLLKVVGLHESVGC